MLGDDVLLSFMVPTNAFKIRVKTTMITVAHLEEYLSLRCSALLRMLRTSTVSNCKAVWSMQTHHYQHTKHDQSSHHSNDHSVDLMDRVDYKVTACQIKSGSQFIMIIYNRLKSILPFHGMIDGYRRHPPSYDTAF